MQDAFPQQPRPRTTVGYRPLARTDVSKFSGNAASVCIVAAAGLGLGVGIAIAAFAGHGKIHPTPPASDALNSHSSGMHAITAVYAASSPSLLSQVENQKKLAVASPLFSPTIKSSVAKSTQHHKKHGAHKGPSKWNLLGRLTGKAKRRPYVSPNPPAAAEAPTGLQLATAAAATGPFFLDIEGDVTIANFDAGAGTIDTYEGSKFVLDKTAVATGTIPWDDFPFNVHYRCDQTGNCTMIHRGATAGAKMLR